NNCRFCYFFDSKYDLAVAALDEDFQKRRVELDAIFSPTVPPLDRIRNYCEFGYRLQEELKKQCGAVLGCPLCTLGAEVSTQDEKLRLKIQEILQYKSKYIETAIRDADAAGLIKAPDAAAKTRMVRAYLEGLLTQARIQNDLGVLRDAIGGVFDLLGVEQAQAAGAY